MSLGKAAEPAGYARMDFARKPRAMEEPVFRCEEALVDEMIERPRAAPSIGGMKKPLSNTCSMSAWTTM